jgi:hypothetical protein
MRLAVLALALGFAPLAAACGGDAGRAASPQVRSPGQPLTIDVAATRVGQALRLDIRALGRGADAGAPFEDPDQWSISAWQRDRPLARLVNGSREIERQPSGVDQWDTVVRFSVVFQVAGASEVRVRLEPPDAPASEHRIDP